MNKIIALALFVLVVALLYPGPAPVAEKTEFPVEPVKTVKTTAAEPVAVPMVAPPPLVVRPEFQKAVNLGEKVLHTKKELAEFRTLLSSPALLKEGFQRLSDTSEKAEGPAAEVARMQTVDFLNAALTWKENPQRAQIVRDIVALLDRSIDDIKAPITLKRSLAGDAMELYFVLFKHEPTQAHDLFERSDATQQRLFRFATKMVQQTQAQKNREVN